MWGVLDGREPSVFVRILWLAQQHDTRAAGSDDGIQTQIARSENCNIEPLTPRHCCTNPNTATQVALQLDGM